MNGHLSLWPFQWAETHSKYKKDNKQTKNQTNNLKKNKKKAKLKDILQVSISTNFQVNKSWFEK